KGKKSKTAAAAAVAATAAAGKGKKSKTAAATAVAATAAAGKGKKSKTAAAAAVAATAAAGKGKKSKTAAAAAVAATAAAGKAKKSKTAAPAVATAAATAAAAAAAATAAEAAVAEAYREVESAVGYLHATSQINASQRDAVLAILCGDRAVQLVQGPPGTGKTTVISHTVALWQRLLVPVLPPLSGPGRTVRRWRVWLGATWPQEYCLGAPEAGAGAEGLQAGGFGGVPFRVARGAVPGAAADGGDYQQHAPGEGRHPDARG
ncbi:hypothetical protein Vretimale_18173, partial [Volvox reticuliferus]